MDLIKARAYILERLDKELDKEIVYHNSTHSIYVHRAVLGMIESEDVSEHQALLLETAASYHDCGFLFSYENHEIAALEITNVVLPSFGYSEEDITIINSLIIATTVGRKPENLLEEIMCDADTWHLGTDSNFMKSSACCQELLLKKKIDSLEEWYSVQEEFLRIHTYYTTTAKITLNRQKKEYLKLITDLNKSIAL